MSLAQDKLTLDGPIWGASGQVNGDVRHGSGFQIGDGYALTAGHVVYEWDRDISDPVPNIVTGNASPLRYTITEYRGVGHYIDAYRSAVTAASAGATSQSQVASNALIEGPLAPFDSVVISNSRTVDSDDAGLCLFMNPAELATETSNHSLSINEQFTRWGAQTGETHGIITSVNSSTNVFYYNILANTTGDESTADSGGAYYITLDGKHYVFGTQSANQGSYAVGDYFSQTDFVTLNTLLESGHVGNVTDSEPQNLVVGGSTSSDTITGTFRSDRIYGKGGEDNISDGDLPDDAVWADDILYGGAGNDTFKVGRGNDTIYGGDPIVGGISPLPQGIADGIDTVDYSDWNAPITFNFFGDPDGGTVPGAIMWVGDGKGGEDWLYSIEVVKATKLRDLFKFDGDVPAGLTLTIDANGGQTGIRNDVLNFAELEEGFALDIQGPGEGTSGTIKSKEHGTEVGAGLITLLNFNTDIIGSEFDDEIIDASSAPKNIRAGSGNDEVTVTIGKATIFGEDGDDIITGGQGNDLLLSGSGGYDTHDGLSDQIFGMGGSDRIIASLGASVDGGDGADYITIDANQWSGDDLVDAYVKGGAGNDFIDLSQISPTAEPTVINFGSGDGHDTVAGSTSVEQLDGAQVTVSRYTGILFDLNVSSSDIELVWDAHRVQPDDAIMNQIHGGPPSGGEPDFAYCVGDAVLRIKSTGETIFLANLTGWYLTGVDTWEPNDPPLFIPDLNVMCTDGGLTGWSHDAANSWLEIVQPGPASGYETALADYQAAVAADTDSTAGSAAGDQLSGTQGDDNVQAGDGDDDISLSGGNDLIDGGDGDDTLSVFGSYTSMSFSLSATGVLVVEDLTYDLHASKATLTNVENIFFAEEGETVSVANLISMFGTEGNDSITGTQFGDTLDGKGGNDIIRGGVGDDFIDGGDGIDRADFAGNSTDYLAFVDWDGSIKVSDTVSTDGWDTLNNVESLHFDGDNVTIEVDDLPPLGTSGDDTILGSNRPDWLLGFEGNDVLEGMAGADTLSGDIGDDTLRGGDGDDSLLGGEGNDIIEAGDGNNPYILGGGGNDTISSGSGDDAFLYFWGDGADIISDSGGEDYLSLAFDQGDVSDVTSNGTDYVISLSDGGSITILGGATPSGTIETIYFNDGSWTAGDLAAIAVAGVNDAPVNLVPSATQAVNEDGTIVFNTANGNAVSVSDVDAGSSPISVTLSVESGALNLGSTSNLTITGNGTNAVTLSGTVTAVNAALDGLGYNPGANYNGDRTITITTDDQGNSGIGGSQQDVDTIAVHVTAINDAPVVIGDGTVDAAAINEDVPGSGQTVSTLFAGQYSDVADAQFGAGNPGGSSPGSFSGVAVVANGSSASTGQWQYYNATSSTWVNVGSVSDSSALLIGAGTLVRFNPAPDFNGAAPTLTVHLIDNSLGFGITYGQTANISGVGATGGTTSYSSGTVVLSQNVTAVNDAPVNSMPSSRSGTEDTNLVFSTGNGNAITVADKDAATLQVTLAATHGVLTLSGTTGLSFLTGDGTGDTTMTFSGTAAQINAALNGLIYRGDLNYNGGANLTVSTSDLGATGTGGTLTDQDVIAITLAADGNIDGTAGNDNLTGTGNADQFLLQQGGSDSASGGNGNDRFYFGDQWDAGDSVDGGSGTDSLQLAGDYNFTFGASQLTSIEVLRLLSGGASDFDYALTMVDGNVAGGQQLQVDGSGLIVSETLTFVGMAESNGSFQILSGAGDDTLVGGQNGDSISGGAGRDTIYGLAGNDSITGGLGGDVLIGGVGVDTFVYTAAAQSSGVNFDRIEKFSYYEDKIDLPTAVSGWTGTANGGALSTATFDANIATAVDALLQGNSAVLFNPNSGDLAGHSFAVIDANGDGNYQASQDYVIEFWQPLAPVTDTASYFI